LSKIFHSLEEAGNRFGPCALAMGNFDGVHIGHRKLIGDAARCARASGLAAAVLTFDPHPTAIVAPDRVPPLICPLEERLRLIGEAGAERIFVLRFTSEIARLTPEQFVSQVLIAGLGIKAVFVGEGFHFGHKQSGTPDVLKKLGTRYGFSTCFIPPVMLGGRIVSSTAVREALSKGNVVAAGRLLGRCYGVSGKVVAGRGIGSKETVPTLNLKPGPELIVPHGIFVTETLEPSSGRRWQSVTSCGYNPTFGATDLTVETFLLGGLEGESPAEISVQFRHFLRPEIAYPDAASLKKQILRDVARAESYWRHAERLGRTAPSIY
jgi:riboflavin kinase / FMN adenylyltransferase